MYFPLLMNHSAALQTGTTQVALAITLGIYEKVDTIV